MASLDTWDDVLFFPLVQQPEKDKQKFSFEMYV